jgi:hypothetical protein
MRNTQLLFVPACESSLNRGYSLLTAVKVQRANIQKRKEK